MYKRSFSSFNLQNYAFVVFRHRVRIFISQLITVQFIYHNSYLLDCTFCIVVHNKNLDFMY